jgi:flagellin-like protein
VGVLRLFVRNRKGISEIVGALMLIIVVVVAVGALAFFVSTMETQAMNRQSLLTSVQDENLQIVSITPTMVNPTVDPTIDFILQNATSPQLQYYVAYGNDDSGTIYNCTSYGDTDSYTLSIEGSYAQLIAGSSVGLSINTATSATLNFSGSNFTVEPATWRSINVTIRNLNINPSSIRLVEINNQYPLMWNDSDTTDSSNPYNYTSQSIPMVIPAAQYRTITIDLRGNNITVTKYDSLTVQITTPEVNSFSETILAPTALVKLSASLENLMVNGFPKVQDVYTLDGSQSYSYSNSSIVNYIWQLEIPTFNLTGTDLANVTTIRVNAVGFQYDNVLSQELNNPDLNITGPIMATLEVINQNGIASQPSTIIIPNDQYIEPQPQP